MTSNGRDAIVVGGGVIGAACAYYLSQSGWQVSILERGEFGRGCSHGNCGFICPSHVLPLAEPGAIGKALRALRSKNAPFSIRPRWDPRLWMWLLKFARRANRRDMLAAGAGCQALLNSSLELYKSLIAEEQLDCEWQQRGLLLVYRDPAAIQEYAQTATLLREHFHQPIDRYDGSQVRELEPALRAGLAGGWHFRSDAHLRPDKLMSEWRRVLLERGVQIREHCEITDFARTDGRARAVITTQGQFQATAFVVATGALTPGLEQALDCRVPIQPGKGYSITMPRPALCPQIPLLFPETHVGVTPMQSAYRLGSTMEFAGYDSSISEQRLDLLRRGAEPYLEEPACGPVVERWYGWRPMTYDGLPIIDRLPAMDNVLIAAGHNMLGVSMAPATGKLVAELLDHRTPHIEPAPYSLSRL
jgi:D-amino-acid dehydrogenase